MAREDIWEQLRCSPPHPHIYANIAKTVELRTRVFGDAV